MQKNPGSKKPNEKLASFKTSKPVDLITFLKDCFPGKSRKNILSLLKHRQVSIDHKIVTQYNHPIEAGQNVTVNFSKVIQGSPKKGLKIIFEDSYLVVIEKPHGLLSIATDKEKFRTAYRILSDQTKMNDPRNRIFIIHRLDREASGIMMFAKNKMIQEQLQKSWQDEVIERKYAVVVEGIVEKNEDTVVSWLKENTTGLVYSTQIPNEGQKAITHYRVLKRNRKFSLLEVELETGRKNQIRVQMKEIGHPVIGDRKYGAKSDAIRRLGLHAMVLSFIHPVSGEKMHFETAVPELFLTLFKKSAEQ